MGDFPFWRATSFICRKVLRGSFNQVQVVSNRHGWVAATRCKHHRGNESDGSPEATIHQTLQLHPLEGGRDNGDAETHRHKVERRCEAKGLMANPRTKARRMAGGNRVGVQAQPLLPSLNDECFASKCLQ